MLPRMAAVEHVSEDLGAHRHPLEPGATLGVIREHLLPEDRPQFDLELGETADDGARRWDRIEHWRAVAVIQSDREGFTAIVRRAAALNTGVPVPEDEPFETTRAKAGM